MTGVEITNSQLVRYGSLAIPVAFAGFPLYVLAPDYYAVHHGIPLTLLGLILLGLRMFDAVQDPLIGALSDRYRNSSSGFMILSAALLCLSVYGLFNEVFGNAAWWFALCMAVAVSSYSVLSINLNALGALWTNDKTAQTRIAAMRESFGLIGLLIAVSLPNLLLVVLGDDEVYLWFSLALTVLMGATLIAFLPWLATQKHKSPTKNQESFSWAVMINAVVGQKWLFAVYGLSMLASAIPAILVLFFVRDLLGAEQLTGVFLLLYFLSGVLGMPLWKRLSEKYSKEKAWIISMLLAVGGFVWAFFLGVGDVWQYGIICFISGLALGADLALPPSMLADRLHESNSGQHAAMQYSILALVSKASLAIASAIALPALDMAGFRPQQANSADALLALSASYAAIPCALKLTAGALLYFTSTHLNTGALNETNAINNRTGSTNHV